MPDIIQLLPDHVANQIAAGEVVQRPASIVKELLENAIDAQATKIELILTDAGRNLVQVVDNGIGMSETDARLAFERHATSKIRSTEDIFKIISKGFRGEALASIAAVAQVEMKTKKADSLTGTTLYIEGGQLQFQAPSQAAEGTSLAVKNLFYNVPARRKFLKNNNVEFRHVLDEFHRVALPHPEVEMDLFHNEEPIFRLRRTSALQRIVDIFGRRLQPQLITIQEDIGWLTLSGFVAKPEGAKRARGEQFFFVNNRYFKSPYLNRAVQEAFDGLLAPGHLPSFFLFLEIDPSKIDVNIHPQKTEVKFEDEHLIFALVRSTIKRALGIYNVAPSLDFEKDPTMDELLHASSRQATPGFSPQHITVDRDFNPFQLQRPMKAINTENVADYLETLVQTVPSKLNLFDEEEDEYREDLMRLPNGYWLLNRGEKTLMLDLGRMYRLTTGFREERPSQNRAAQRLLFSLEYHMNEMEKNKFRSIKKYLPNLGFEMELGNDNMLRINAIPAGLQESMVPRFLESLFEVMDYRTEEDFMNFYDSRWNRLYSKSRFDFIHKADAELVIRDFAELGFPQYLPDGKTCYIELPLDDFKNKF